MWRPLLSPRFRRVAAPARPTQALSGHVGLRSVPDPLSNLCSIRWSGGDRTTRTWAWLIAAPLERGAELLGVDLAMVRELAAKVEPYLLALMAPRSGASCS